MFTYPTPADAGTAGYAMVADRFALLLGAEAGAGIAADLWSTMTAADAAFEDVLSVIAAIGIGALPDFALVELVDVASSSVSVAVRGTATIDLHGPQRSSYAGGGVGTWVEGSAREVAGISLSLAGDDDGGPLPLGRGVARSNGLRWGAEPASSPAPIEAVAASREHIVEPTAFLGDLDPLETVAIDRGDLAAAVGPRRTPPPAEPSAADDDAVEDETILGSRRPRVADAPPPGRTARLRIDPGGEVPLDHPVVLGRGPRAADHPGARIAAVPSPRKEVSSTHLEVRLDGDELVLRDLDSTNGTVVRRPDGDVTLLRGGATLRVEVGTVLDLGDGVIVVFDTTP